MGLTGDRNYLDKGESYDFRDDIISGLFRKANSVRIGKFSPAFAFSFCRKLVVTVIIG